MAILHNLGFLTVTYFGIYKLTSLFPVLDQQQEPSSVDIRFQNAFFVKKSLINMTETNENSMSENEKKVFEAIVNNDAVLLKALLTENPQNVNILDENQMTPLQHAAYKGNKELVQILLDQVTQY